MDNPFTQPTVGGPLAAQAGEYLTLRLGDEEYAMDILQVQELRSYEQPIRMVNSPPFIKGVIDLRGVIVPIVDLRLKFNLAVADYSEATVVVILCIHGSVIGVVVDAVSDVVAFDAGAIRPAPQFESAIDARFIVGLVHAGERMLIVLDMDTLLSGPEVGLTARVASKV